MIQSEDDVRAYVRQASAGRARWVEPALGSTPGLPDCWVPMECGRQVHLELKAGQLRQGKLSYTVRPEQKKQILAMVDDGVPVGFLIGIKHSDTVIFAVATPKVIFGKWPMQDLVLAKHWRPELTTRVGGFWSGVNFIFSDFQKGV